MTGLTETFTRRYGRPTLTLADLRQDKVGSGVAPGKEFCEAARGQDVDRE